MKEQVFNPYMTLDIYIFDGELNVLEDWIILR